jgi:hypothetical protein
LTQNAYFIRERRAQKNKRNIYGDVGEAARLAPSLYETHTVPFDPSLCDTSAREKAGSPARALDPVTMGGGCELTAKLCVQQENHQDAKRLDNNENRELSRAGCEIHWRNPLQGSLVWASGEKNEVPRATNIKELL